MPKTAIDEDRDLRRDEYDVCSPSYSWEDRAIDAEA
jgi:hypothetical protein